MKRCSVDVVNASHSGVFEDEEARYFHLVVVTSLHRHEQSMDNSKLSDIAYTRRTFCTRWPRLNDILESYSGRKQCYT